jgi:hypothetical protein
MNARITSVSEALELLVPPFERVDSDEWAAIVAAAELTAPERRAGLVTRRRIVVIAIAIAVLATLVATPAFGIRGLIADLFGRHDVKFTGKTAPIEVKRNFFELSLGAPSSMAPHVIASQARRVARFVVRGRTHVLFVAPTRAGGYCWQFSGAFGGCRARRDLKVPLGVTFGESTVKDVQSVAYVGGDITASNAYSLTVEFANGTRMPVPFYFVSKPIEAGFFYSAIPAGHDAAKTRAVAAVLRDRAGHVLGRQAFAYERPAQVARNRARIKAMLKQIGNQRNLQRPITRSPRLPVPTPPFQRAEAGGVVVVAGHNGVVVFDTSHATPAVRALISGRGVGYGCFKRIPYNSEPVDLTFLRTTLDRVAIRQQGVMSPPFVGCNIQGSYGHLWPDRNHSHSAFEVAFTPAGRRFLEDRAAARDLALFVRSRSMHSVRKLSGDALARAVRGRYGAQIVRLNSTASSLPFNRIGYATNGATTTFVERSPSGRRFYVHVMHGRIRGQNVRPLAFVF